jgi:alkylation response protein AidB-like acyl-CoA dehydrogenase
MNIDQFLKPDVVRKRKATEKFMDKIYDDLIPHVNNASMPFWIVPKIQKLGINGF